VRVSASRSVKDCLRTLRTCDYVIFSQSHSHVHVHSTLTNLRDCRDKFKIAKASGHVVPRFWAKSSREKNRGCLFACGTMTLTKAHHAQRWAGFHEHYTWDPSACMHTHIIVNIILLRKASAAPRPFFGYCYWPWASAMTLNHP